MSKFTYAIAVAALVLGTAFAQAAPVRDSSALWPTDYRSENSGDFQLQGR